MDPKHAVIHQAADSGLPWGMILQWLATFGFPLVIQVLMVIVPLLKPGTKIHDIAKWQTRLDEFADNDKIKSLREEIGVLRILLEETMSRCHDTNELLLYSNKISELVIKIEKVVASCHRLENATGMLLDKSAALH